MYFYFLFTTCNMCHNSNNEKKTLIIDYLSLKKVFTLNLYHKIWFKVTPFKNKIVYFLTNHISISSPSESIYEQSIDVKIVLSCRNKYSAIKLKSENIIFFYKI